MERYSVISRKTRENSQEKRNKKQIGFSLSEKAAEFELFSKIKSMHNSS
jgi:hypothetical protein